MRADQLTEPLAYHGEGPVWLSGTLWPSGLYWLDMLAGDVLHLAADGAEAPAVPSSGAMSHRPSPCSGRARAVGWSTPCSGASPWTTARAPRCACCPSSGPTRACG